jgi:hypothetical protein
MSSQHVSSQHPSSRPPASQPPPDRSIPVSAPGGGVPFLERDGPVLFLARDPFWFLQAEVKVVLGTLDLVYKPGLVRTLKPKP